jgi:hypothetical protein
MSIGVWQHPDIMACIWFGPRRLNAGRSITICCLLSFPWPRQRTKTASAALRAIYFAFRVHITTEVTTTVLFTDVCFDAMNMDATLNSPDGYNC